MPQKPLPPLAPPPWASPEKEKENSFHLDRVLVERETPTPSLVSTTPSTALLEEDAPSTLLFHKISTSSPCSASTFCLNGISGWAQPGQILAVMGPTGCGKTTLLNVISGRTPLKSGEILVNGEPISRRMWRTKFAYVLQQDVFFPLLTLKQTLLYQALLRLPDSMPYKEKEQKVEDIIEILDLYKCQSTRVGDEVGLTRGLSGGEKKRLSIACELITNPSVLVIDEPTSGLDSFTAIQLIKTLKNFAQSYSKNVILTVHQPSSRMFTLFDSLLALSAGRTAYFGKASEMTLHMESVLSLPIEPNYNPADFLLEKLKYEEAKLIQGWERYERDSAPLNILHTNAKNGNLVQVNVNVKSQNQNEALEDNNSNTLSMSISPKSSCPSWQTSFFTQVRVLTRRNVQLAFPRIFSTVNLVQTLVLAVMSGLVWFRLDRREENVSNLEGWMFFSANYWMLFVLFQALWAFPPEKPIIQKERKAGAYRLSSYYVSKILGELPLELGLPFLYFLISYVMIGGSWASTLGVLGSQALSSVAAQSVGLFFSSIMEMGPSTTLAAIFTVAAQLLGGYLTDNVPKFLRLFSLVYNGMRNLQVAEYKWGPPVLCGREVNQTRYPGSCRGEALEEFIEGEELLAEKDETEFPLWASTVVLILFILVFRVLAYVSLRRQL